MILTIANALIALSKILPQILEIADRIAEWNNQLKIKQINDRSSARAKARAELLKALSEVKDEETRLEMANAIYNFNRMSNN